MTEQEMLASLEEDNQKLQEDLYLMNEASWRRLLLGRIDQLIEVLKVPTTTEAKPKAPKKAPYQPDL